MPVTMDEPGPIFQRMMAELTQLPERELFMLVGAILGEFVDERGWDLERAVREMAGALQGAAFEEAVEKAERVH